MGSLCLNIRGRLGARKVCKNKDGDLQRDRKVSVYPYLRGFKSCCSPFLPYSFFSIVTLEGKGDKTDFLVFALNFLSSSISKATRPGCYHTGPAQSVC